MNDPRLEIAMEALNEISNHNCRCNYGCACVNGLIFTAERAYEKIEKIQRAMELSSQEKGADDGK